MRWRLRFRSSKGLREVADVVLVMESRAMLIRIAQIASESMGEFQIAPDAYERLLKTIREDPNAQNLSGDWNTELHGEPGNARRLACAWWLASSGCAGC
ncbi:MAG: hypothetical protein FWD57_06205 [Polyangiaceae bacterium]|nr:hypothetical protein [Polyangiaceae bacterium]